MKRSRKIFFRKSQKKKVGFWGLDVYKKFYRIFEEKVKISKKVLVLKSIIFTHILRMNFFRFFQKFLHNFFRPKKKKFFFDEIFSRHFRLKKSKSEKLSDFKKLILS